MTWLKDLGTKLSLWAKFTLKPKPKLKLKLKSDIKLKLKLKASFTVNLSLIYAKA